MITVGTGEGLAIAVSVGFAVGAGGMLSDVVWRVLVVGADSISLSKPFVMMVPIAIAAMMTAATATKDVTAFLIQLSVE